MQSAHDTRYTALDSGEQPIGTASIDGHDIEISLDEPMKLASLRLIPAVAPNLLLAESLTCGDCGNDGPDSLAEAIADGWKDVEHQPEGLSWNFLGTCPCCSSR